MSATSLRVDLGGRSYDVVVGRGAWSGLAPLLAVSLRPKSAVVVTDERVFALYGREVLGLVESSQVPCTVHCVPCGEDSKSLSELERLCRHMAHEGLERSSLVVALGGGVVGDLAGFASAVFLRGIGFVQLPTTLLAMVDSSVGGKTGVNLPEGKNLVGSFHQPSAVLADTRSLSTLESRDWYSGLAEVVKVALTLDPDLFGYLEAQPDLSPSGPVDPVRIILAACARKAQVVAADEREGGLRRVLNFGHTLAHGIEAALGYGVLRHGEAVVLGMRAALRLSVELCGLSIDEEERALAVLARIPVPSVPLGEDLGPFLMRDKKVSGGRIQAVLLEKIGKPCIRTLNDPQALLRALDASLIKRTSA